MHPEQQRDPELDSVRHGGRERRLRKKGKEKEKKITLLPNTMLLQPQCNYTGSVDVPSACDAYSGDWLCLCGGGWGGFGLLAWNICCPIQDIKERERKEEER